MNKQEIEHKLEQARKDERAINDNIIKLLEQLAEAEKPKLRHGDFGIEDGKFPTVILQENQFGDLSNLRSIREGHSCSSSNKTRPEYHHSYTIFGNIFDLMKDWGEGLEHFTLDVNHYSINPVDFAHAPIHIAGNWHTEAEAYKFWCDFGQMLMTLKRKQS